MTAWMVGAFIQDVYLRVPRLPRPGESLTSGSSVASPGGKAANQAVAAARLGTHTCLVAAVGNDQAGRDGLAALTSAGVGTEAASVVGGGCDQSLILLADDAQQVIVNVPRASEQLTEEHIAAALRTVSEGDVLSVQGEIPLRLTRAAISACEGAATVVLNPSPLAAFLAGPGGWGGVDLIIVNEGEARELTGLDEPAQALADAIARRTGVSDVVVTSGEAGALLRTADACETLPAPFVESTDPTGAGDGFTAALVYGLSVGMNLEDACRLGVAVGAHAVEHLGCFPGYPTMDELRSWAELRAWSLPAAVG